MMFDEATIRINDLYRERIGENISPFNSLLWQHCEDLLARMPQQLRLWDGKP